jgi:membrane protease YdiL (CAAX protease family)
MWQRFSEDARRAVFRAQDVAQSEGCETVYPRHLLDAVLQESPTVEAILGSLGVDLDALAEKLERPLGNEQQESQYGWSEMSLSTSTKRVIDQAYNAAKAMRLTHIGCEVLLLGVMRAEPSLVAASYEDALAAVKGSLGIVDEPPTKDGQDRPFTSEGRRIVWLELAAVLMLFDVPAMWTGLQGLLTGHYAASSDLATRAVLVASRVCPLLFIIFASGDGLRHFGIRRPKLDDLYWSLPLLAALFAIAEAASWPLSAFGMPYPDSERTHLAFRVHQMRTDPWTLLALLALSASQEELFSRGYLVTRLRELLGSPWTAVTVGAVPFALGHLYEGAAGVLGAYCSGLVLGWAFLKLRSVWPLILAHAIFDWLLYAMYSWHFLG